MVKIPDAMATHLKYTTQIISKSVDEEDALYCGEMKTNLQDPNPKLLYAQEKMDWYTMATQTCAKTTVRQL